MLEKGLDRAGDPSLPAVDVVQPELFGTWTPAAWGGWPMWLWLSPAGLP